MGMRCQESDSESVSICCVGHTHRHSFRVAVRRIFVVSRTLVIGRIGVSHKPVDRKQASRKIAAIRTDFVARRDAAHTELVTHTTAAVVVHTSTVVAAVSFLLPHSHLHTTAEPLHFTRVAVQTVLSHSLSCLAAQREQLPPSSLSEPLHTHCIAKISLQRSSSLFSPCWLEGRSPEACRFCRLSAFVAGEEVS